MIKPKEYDLRLAEEIVSEYYHIPKGRVDSVPVSLINDIVRALKEVRAESIRETRFQFEWAAMGIVGYAQQNEKDPTAAGALEHWDKFRKL